MVRTLKPRDVNLEFKSLRLLDMFSSSPSHSRGLPKGGLELPPKPSTKNNLARVAPFTSAVVARRHTAEAWADEGAAEGENSLSSKEEVIAHMSGYNLDFCESKVT